MSADDIQQLIKDFGSAARRAYESGYDMVQLNGGHGWLLNNFQSAYINQRTDEYGGSTEGRTKVLVDIYNEITDQTDKNTQAIDSLGQEIQKVKIEIEEVVDNMEAAPEGTGDAILAPVPLKKPNESEFSDD